MQAAPAAAAAGVSAAAVMRGSITCHLPPACDLPPGFASDVTVFHAGQVGCFEASAAFAAVAAAAAIAVLPGSAAAATPVPNGRYDQAPQQPQQKSVQLTLLADASSGRTYEFEAEGRILSFQVPQAYGPGMQIMASYLIRIL